MLFMLILLPASAPDRVPEPSISVFDAPDSRVANRVSSGLLIPRPGTEWKAWSALGESVLAKNGTVEA